jgi:integrase/recombinase XerC
MDIQPSPANSVTIEQAIEKFLDTLSRASSDKTIRTYRTALRAFCLLLKQNEIDAKTIAAAVLDYPQVEAFIDYIDQKAYSPSTEKLYLTAVRSFYDYLSEEDLAKPNLGKLQRSIRGRERKLQWSPDIFPRDGMEKLIVYAQSLDTKSVESEGQELKHEAAILKARKAARLRHLRDRALILLLADTGLRVAEACSLTYGQIDGLEARLRNVQRKGYKRKGKKAGSTVLVSERALAAIRDYQEARKGDELPTGMKRKSIPLFVRHDPGAVTNLHTMTEKTAWKIVKERAKEILGEEAAAAIHPHSFRHYFVTVVLIETDLETARRLAGHASADTTSRYAEIDPEVEERYHNIFNKREKKA